MIKSSNIFIRNSGLQSESYGYGIRNEYQLFQEIVQEKTSNIWRIMFNFFPISIYDNFLQFFILHAKTYLIIYSIWQSPFQNWIWKSIKKFLNCFSILLIISENLTICSLVCSAFQEDKRLNEKMFSNFALSIFIGDFRSSHSSRIFFKFVMQQVVTYQLMRLLFDSPINDQRYFWTPLKSHWFCQLSENISQLKKASSWGQTITSRIYFKIPKISYQKTKK